MTEDMFGLDLPLTPYRQFCYGLSFVQLLNIPQDNTYLVWLEGALEECRLKGFWHLVAYSTDPGSRAWTLFYRRKRYKPKVILPGLREMAFFEGTCGQAGEEKHFLDLDYGRPMVDYGRNERAA